MHLLLFSLFILALLALFLPYYRRYVTLKRWRNNLNLDNHQPIYHQLFRAIDGYQLSRQARASHDAIEYTYGEIDFTAFIALITLTNPTSNTVFYDLGSGIGTAIFAYSLVFPFRACYGIERLPLLHLTAKQQLENLEKYPAYANKCAKIHFINDDFLQVKLTHATLIFINATAYFGEIWQAINQHLNHVQIGTLVITTSKKITSKQFRLIKTTTVLMSWGPVITFIHEKIHDEIKSKPIPSVNEHRVF